MKVWRFVRDPRHEACQRRQRSHRIEIAEPGECGIIGRCMDSAMADRVERGGVLAALAFRNDVVPLYPSGERPVTKRADGRRCCGEPRFGFNQSLLALHASHHRRSRDAATDLQRAAQSA